MAYREREADGDKKAHAEICWTDQINSKKYNRSKMIDIEEERSGKKFALFYIFEGYTIVVIQG